jgi:hypothetical protein
MKLLSHLGVFTVTLIISYGRIMDVHAAPWAIEHEV